MNNKRLIIGILVVCVVAAVLYSGVPTGVNYQGRYEESGTPVTGTRTFRFKIYDAEVGGNLLWDSGDVSLSVVNGLFNYVLDCSTIDWRNTTPYLEITVGGTVLSPREKIQASPYAFYCSSANYAYSSAVAENANKLAGQQPSYYLDTSATAQTKSGNLSVNTLTANKLVLNSSTVTVGGVEMFFVPRGAIIMWSGSVASIPPGWALCDGTNGTPDLRDKFIVCAGGSYSVGATGGSTSHTHTVDIAAFTSGSESSHTHSINPPSATTSSAGAHSHIAYVAQGGGYIYTQEVDASYTATDAGTLSGSATGTYNLIKGTNTNSAGAHTHTVDIAAFTSGAGSAHSHSVDPPATTSSSASHMPPYYALCFIMKL